MAPSKNKINIPFNIFWNTLIIFKPRFYLHIISYYNLLKLSINNKSMIRFNLIYFFSDHIYYSAWSYLFFFLVIMNLVLWSQTFYSFFILWCYLTHYKTNHWQSHQPHPPKSTRHAADTRIVCWFNNFIRGYFH